MRFLSTLLFLAFCLIACAELNPKNQDSLREAVLLFNEGVRWGRLQDVMPRVAPDSAAHFIEMHKEFGKSIKVSDYEIVNTTVDWEKKIATVVVQIIWYRNTEMELFTTQLSQRWEEVGRDWLMMTETHLSGETF